MTGARIGIGVGIRVDIGCRVGVRRDWLRGMVQLRVRVRDRHTTAITFLTMATVKVMVALRLTLWL